VKNNLEIGTTGTTIASMDKNSKSTEETPKAVYFYPRPFSKIFQFKITLLETDPPVWRRIQVPGCYTFWDLHCAITDAFGWLDYHLDLFTIKNPKTGSEDHFGIPDPDGMHDEEMGYVTKPSWMSKISHYFILKPIENTHADYLYDFGDGWHHSVVLEKIMTRTDKKLANTYPCCIDGANACPPEDCGGPWGYQRFKKSIAYHNAEDHKDMLKWVGGWFDPEWFDVGLVRFEDPWLRWDIAFIKKPCPKDMRMVQYHRMNGLKKG